MVKWKTNGKVKNNVITHLSKVTNSFSLLLVSLKMTGAELFIGGRSAITIIGKVVDLGYSYLRDNNDLHTGTKQMLTNLGIQLPRIQSLIEAAEKRQITGTGLKNWLELLKNAAYEAEDVLL